MPSFSDPIVDFNINFNELLSGSISVDEKRRIGREVLSAFEKYGFVYLKDFGKIDEWVSEFKACGDAFFDLSKEEKDKHVRSFKTFHGYLYQVDEKPDGCPTVHETYDITSLEEIPDEFSELKKCSKNGLDYLQSLIMLLYSCLEFALELEPGFLTSKSNFSDKKNIWDLRLLRHPPLPESETNIPRMFDHKDIDALTIIIQDDVGGLEVKNPYSGEWQESRGDIPNSVILIAGRQMPLVTDDRIKGVIHRVVTRKQETKFRRSVIFFAQFDNDVLLKLESDPTSGKTVTVEEFLKRTIAETYPIASKKDPK